MIFDYFVVLVNINYDKAKNYVSTKITNFLFYYDFYNCRFRMPSLAPYFKAAVRFAPSGN